MEELLVVLVGIVAGILGIVAFSRSREHARQIEDLQRDLTSTTERLRTLERMAAQSRVPTPPAAPPQERAVPPVVREPAGVVEPPPVLAERPDVVAPPPVVAPPVVRSPVSTWPPTVSATTEQPSLSAEPPPIVEHTPFVPAEPPQPSAFMRWLTGGNPLAKVGIVLLFFGIAFLVRYAAERDLISIQLRLTGAAVIALGLLAIGWRLRRRSPVYALTLQGGAIGGLYLTSFAAFKIYELLPHGLVFGLLIVICAASVALAVLQRAQGLAVLASLGGYLAPILLSTGSGDHVALFSYYALLSLGILAVSIWQSWRPLNLVGFFFTFGVGGAWGADRYEPSLYAACQFFLALNVIVYGVLSVLMALRRGDSREAAIVDGSLAFGTPLVGFGLQVGLTRHWEYGPALSALAFAALYLPLSWFTLKRWPERGRRLVITFLALGAGFTTLAIPLALSARYTSMAWALEGLGILWVGRMQRQVRLTWTGTGLLVLAGCSAWIAISDGLDTSTYLLLTATLAMTWLSAGLMWHRTTNLGDVSRGASLAFLVAGIVAWLMFVAGGSEKLISTDILSLRVALAGVSVSAIAWQLAGARLRWPALFESALVLWPVMFLALAAQLVLDSHPLGGGAGALLWPLAFAVAWQILRNVRTMTPESRRGAAHMVLWWLAFVLVAVEVFWRMNRHGWGEEEWPIAGTLVVCGAFALVVWQMSRRGHWALATYPGWYWLGALTPPMTVAAVLLVTGNFLDGKVPGLPYIPLINVLEEPAMFALLMGVLWHRGAASFLHKDLASLIRAVLVIFTVWWVNGVFLRTLALVGSVPWSYDALWESAFIQTSIALAWTVVALVCMWMAARSARRVLWFAGAGALALVVAKLFMVDIARTSGLGRAVAFIGVALLILLMGYVAPLPPRERPREEAAS